MARLGRARKQGRFRRIAWIGGAPPWHRQAWRSASVKPATARIQDYQVARLLSYKTQCEMARLEDRSLKNGPVLFFAECENKTFYPDGIEISCSDRDDDRSCRVLTKEKSFDQLHLLDRKDR